MGRIRGLFLKHRVKTVFGRRFQGICRKLIRWTGHLGTKTKAIARNMKPGRGYIRVGQEPVLAKPDRVPKGSMAIYVGQKDGACQRIMVPVVYLNHPLFVDLLKESESEYGFEQLGGLTIPCQVSEFERVQTWIEASWCTRKFKR